MPMSLCLYMNKNQIVIYMSARRDGCMSEENHTRKLTNMQRYSNQYMEETFTRDLLSLCRIMCSVKVRATGNFEKMHIEERGRKESNYIWQRFLRPLTLPSAEKRIIGYWLSAAFLEVGLKFGLASFF